MDWSTLLKERAGPQSRNAVLGFLALIGVMFSVMVPDFIAFHSHYSNVYKLENERDELNGKRDYLVQRVIVRGNSSEINGLYWDRKFIETDDGTKPGLSKLDSEDFDKAKVKRFEIDIGKGYDEWRKKRAPEQLILEFASHATAAELQAYDRANEHLVRLSQKIGIYRTETDLGLPTIDFAVVKWGVPLVWLIALSLALWPLWELRQTLMHAQKIADSDDGHAPPFLSFITVTQEKQNLRIAPSFIFRTLCFVMALLTLMACWMSYGYATAGFGPTGISSTMQTVVQLSTISIAAVVSACLLRISFWGPEATDADGESTHMIQIPRRTMIAGALSAISVGIISRIPQWRGAGTGETAPYFRVRPPRIHVQMVVDRAKGFYWLEEPWQKYSDPQEIDGPDHRNLVYLEDASDVITQPNRENASEAKQPPQVTSVLYGYDLPVNQLKLERLDELPDSYVLESLSTEGYGTLRSYWIEHAALDLVEEANIPAAAELLNNAIHIDVRQRLARGRSVSVRLIDLYGYLVPRNERKQHLDDWILAARNLGENDRKWLENRQKKWGNYDLKDGLEKERRSKLWNLPRRQINGHKKRSPIAREVNIG